MQRKEGGDGTRPETALPFCLMIAKQYSSTSLSAKIFGPIPTQKKQEPKKKKKTRR